MQWTVFWWFTTWPYSFLIGGGLEIYRCTSFLYVWFSILNNWFFHNFQQYTPGKCLAVFHTKAYSVQILQRFSRPALARSCADSGEFYRWKQLHLGAIVDGMIPEELRHSLYGHGIVKVLRKRLPEFVLWQHSPLEAGRQVKFGWRVHVLWWLHRRHKAVFASCENVKSLRSVCSSFFSP